LGVIFAVGPRYLPQAYRDRPIEALLPVVPEKLAGRTAPGYDAFGLELTPTGRAHEVVRLYDEPSRNEETWVSLPPFYWCGAAQRLRPGAVALAVNRALKNDYGPIPLIAYQEAGDGAALYAGLDSTWSWRQNVADRYFYKFWGQALRFVSRRPGDGKDRARLEAAPLKLAPGEEVALALRAPGGGETAEVTIERIGDVETGRADPAGVAPPARLLLHRDPEQAGAARFAGKLKIGQEGRFLATYQSSSGPVTAEFLSMEGIAEFQRPEVNREALEAAAQNSGGKMVELHELDQLVPLLQGETTFRRLRHQQELWDKWFTVLLVALLYCGDVAIRRTFGLA
jgi:hypothetical protein